MDMILNLHGREDMQLFGLKLASGIRQFPADRDYRQGYVGHCGSPAARARSDLDFLDRVVRGQHHFAPLDGRSGLGVELEFRPDLLDPASKELELTAQRFGGIGGRDLLSQIFDGDL